MHILTNNQIYIALLKFDFFFFLGFTVQFSVVVVKTGDTEFALTVAAVPVTILILLLAAYFTRKENTPGMIVIIVRNPILDLVSDAKESSCLLQL